MKALAYFGSFRWRETDRCISKIERESRVSDSHSRFICQGFFVATSVPSRHLLARPLNSGWSLSTGRAGPIPVW